MSYSDVASAVQGKRHQLWPGYGAVMVTKVEGRGKTRRLVVYLAGGNLAELERLYAGVEAWGRAQGCKRVVFAGRKGWQRTFLTRAGFTATPEPGVFEKEISLHDVPRVP
jgi:hypothetical protein